MQNYPINNNDKIITLKDTKRFKKNSIGNVFNINTYSNQFSALFEGGTIATYNFSDLNGDEIAILKN